MFYICGKESTNAEKTLLLSKKNTAIEREKSWKQNVFTRIEHLLLNLLLKLPKLNSYWKKKFINNMLKIH